MADVMAKPLRLVSMFMRLDLPTFERPMNAYSGMLCCGHLLTSVLLITNSALFISILCGFCVCKSTNFWPNPLNLQCIES